MLSLLKRIRRDEFGGTAIEYGLIVALLVIAIITSLQSVADENTGLWATVRSNVETVMSDDA
jgi:pilus assembly protein Flp/PilA